MLFDKFNFARKQNYFGNPLFKAKKKYACIGIGMHSLSNIFPVLHHFNIPVKYICTANHNWKEQVSKLFPTALFTNSITDILQDAEVEAVFVCTSPTNHFGIVEKLLKAGKKVFVEKPLCYSKDELNKLINISPAITCKVGLQRRYWKGNKFVKNESGKMRSYIYQFYFGPYPKGNVIYELFIHALDYCLFIFGPCSILSKTMQKDNGGITLQLHLQHANGVTGLAELSTNHSWANPVEELNILCKNERLTINYPLKVSGLLLPKRLFNIPTERIYPQSVVTKEYFSTGNMINPVAELNTLVLQGFYNELENFILIAEGIKPEENDLKTLVPLYELLDELNAFT